MTSEPSLLSLSDLTFPPGWRARPHAHADHSELLLMTRGVIHLRAGGAEARASAGEVVCYSPMLEHGEWAVGEAPLRMYCLAWRGGEDAARPLCGGDPEGRIAFLLRWMAELFPAQGESEQATLDGLLRALLFEQARAGGTPEQTAVEAARRYVRANLTEPLDLETLAAVACLSRFHFARVFKDATGQSPMTFVRQARVEAARSLLQTTDLPLGVIAAQVGLGDAYHFSRVFKRVTGSPPSALRPSSRR